MPAPLVSRWAAPPSRGTVQRSPAYTNAMCVRLSVGFCSSSGARESAVIPAKQPADNTRTMATRRIRTLLLEARVYNAVAGGIGASMQGPLLPPRFADFAKRTDVVA
jgi:hypothetical protein